MKIRKIIPNFASKRDAVKSELGLENMTFWLQTNENVIEPEASYTVTDDLSITARYTAIDITLYDDSSNSDILFTSDGKKAQKVTLAGRTIYKDGKWNTLCLPFNLTLAGSPLDGDGVVAKTLASSTLRNGALIMNLSDPVTVLQAS